MKGGDYALALSVSFVPSRLMLKRLGLHFAIGSA